jgi:enolase
MLVLFLTVGLMLQNIIMNKSDVLKKILISCGVWLGMVAVASTLMLTIEDGEVTQGSWNEARSKAMIEREYGFHPYLLQSYDGSEDVYDFFEQIKQGKKVLICNAIDSASSYLFGEDNSNDVTFCVIDELADYLYGLEYDVVSISDKFLTPEIEGLFSDSDWNVYRPAQDVLQAHIYVRTR